LSQFDHERPAELLVRGVQEPGAVLLGEALALVAAGGCGCGCGRSAGAGARAGRRSARPARPACCCRRSPSPPGCGRGGPGCVPSAASAPGRTRLRSTARRPGPPPSFYHRPGLLPPASDRGLVPFGGPAGRDLHAPAEPVQQQVQPGQRVLHPEPLPGQLGDPAQRPALVLPAPGGRPGLQHRLQLGQLERGPIARAPPAPLEASTCLPPAASARRHRFADIRDTRNRCATSRSLAPASISPAGASRTCSRRARSAVVSPPLSGYLMTQGIPSTPAITEASNPRL
jgi:hypothetical protein